MERINEQKTSSSEGRLKLSEFLSRELERYLNESEIANISKVSYNTDITRKTLRKVKKGEANLKKMDPSKVFRLYSLVTNKRPVIPGVEEFQKFVNLYRDELNTSTADSTFPMEFNEKDLKFEDYLTTQERFDLALLMKTQRDSCLTRDQVFHKGGHRYLDAAEGLVRDGLFGSEGDVFYLNENFVDYFSSLSKEIIAQRFPKMLNNTSSFTPDGDDEQQSAAFGFVKGWSVQGLENLRVIEKDLFNRLVRLMEDESNLGDIPHGICYTSCSLVDNVPEFQAKGHKGGLQ